MHYLRSFIGTGISQGQGNHYLFYGEDQSYDSAMTDGGQPPPTPGMAGYWCFPATATETEYKREFTVDNIHGTNPVPSVCDPLKTRMDDILKPGLWHLSDFLTDMDPANFTGRARTRSG